MLIDCTPKIFVNFDISTGEIESVGPSKSDTMESIEVSYGEVERILEFKDKKSDYKVVFNTLNKSFELKHESEVQAVYQGFIEVEQNMDHADIEILFSPKNQMIEIFTDIRLLNILDTTSINSEVTFSITEKDNPHVLYSLLQADLRKQNKFLYTGSKTFSIYTKRQFAKYSYRII